MDEMSEVTNLRNLTLSFHLRYNYVTCELAHVFLLEEENPQVSSPPYIRSLNYL